MKSRFLLVALLLGVCSAQAENRQTIVIIGDSLTAGYGLDNPSAQAYPALIQDKIDAEELNYRVVNAGISGDTTAGGLRRISWLLRQKIDILVLALGGNDGLRGIPPKETKKNLLGIIAKALPNATIIHVTRNPMDVGYAMYKTLFRMGYPFSYDLNDIAKYMGSKARLMAHWHTVMPGRIHKIAYEDLVNDIEPTSRALVNATGLDWQDGCLEFHKNKTASATASAAQVRQPVYTSSVEKWRAYETQLAPLADALRAQGIST